MKLYNRKNRITPIVKLSSVFLLFLLTQCLFLDSVNYDPIVKAGEIATFEMNIRVEPLENSSDVRLVIGYLVPKSWDAANNTDVTYTSNIDEGTKTMSLIPEGNLPRNGNGLTWEDGLKNKYGVGPNVLDDMEWIVYWSDQVYSVTNGEKLEATVSLKTKTGPDNLRAKLGFFLNHTNDGLSNSTDHNKVMYTDCFEVVEGEGSVIDFCELHYNSAQPINATKDDILTIKFQGDIGENILDNANEVYFCGTAYTDNGNSYTVCGLEDKAQMQKENEFGHTYSLTFWPAGFFGIPNDEAIIRIDYSFQNEDGSLELQQTSDDETESPFLYEFICK